MIIMYDIMYVYVCIYIYMYIYIYYIIFPHIHLWLDSNPLGAPDAKVARQRMGDGPGIQEDGGHLDLGTAEWAENHRFIVYYSN